MESSISAAGHPTPSKLVLTTSGATPRASWFFTYSTIWLLIILQKVYHTSPREEDLPTSPEVWVMHPHNPTPCAKTRRTCRASRLYQHTASGNAPRKRDKNICRSLFMKKPYMFQKRNTGLSIQQPAGNILWKNKCIMNTHQRSR